MPKMATAEVPVATEIPVPLAAMVTVEVPVATEMATVMTAEIPVPLAEMATVEVPVAMVTVEALVEKVIVLRLPRRKLLPKRRPSRFLPRPNFLPPVKILLLTRPLLLFLRLFRRTFSVPLPQPRRQLRPVRRPCFRGRPAMPFHFLLIRGLVR